MSAPTIAKVPCHLEVLRECRQSGKHFVIIPPSSVAILPAGAFEKIRDVGAIVAIENGEVALEYLLWGGTVRAFAGSDISFVWEDDRQLVFWPTSALYTQGSKADYEKGILVFYAGKLAYCVSKNGKHESQLNIQFVNQKSDGASFALPPEFHRTKLDDHGDDLHADCLSPTLSSLTKAIPKPEAIGSPTKLKPKGAVASNSATLSAEASSSAMWSAEPSSSGAEPSSSTPCGTASGSAPVDSAASAPLEETLSSRLALSSATHPTTESRLQDLECQVRDLKVQVALMVQILQQYLPKKE